MDKQKQGLNVGVKSFLTAIVVILLLMISSFDAGKNISFRISRDFSPLILIIPIPPSP